MLVKIILTSVTSNDLPESLKPLWGRSFELQARVDNIKVYTSDVWACFAVYFGFESENPTQNASSGCDCQPWKPVTAYGHQHRSLSIAVARFGALRFENGAVLSDTSASTIRKEFKLLNYTQ